MPAREDYSPTALARRWVAAYTRLLFLTLAVRQYARGGWPAGGLREHLTDAAFDLVDLADQLRALGYAPTTALAGEEAELWDRAARYAFAVPWRAVPAGRSTADLADDLDAAQRAWAEFVAFAASLSDEPFATSPMTDPRAGRADAAVRVLGRRSGPAPSAAPPPPAAEADRPQIR